jgi:hypothetical protein
MLIGVFLVVSTLIFACEPSDENNQGDAQVTQDTNSVDGSDSTSQKTPMCPEDNFETRPLCTDVFPTEPAFRAAWEFAEGRISGDASFQLGLDDSESVMDEQGKITSLDEDAPKVTVSFDEGGEADFHFAYADDQAIQSVSVNDSVSLSQIDGWSIMKGGDYTIGTREILVNEVGDACLKTPHGFPDARLVPSCQQKIDGDLGCEEPKTPVRVFGLELSDGERSDEGSMIETVTIGDWRGFLELGVQIRPGSTPFCERNGVYATVLLVGPSI